MKVVKHIAILICFLPSFFSLAENKDLCSSAISKLSSPKVFIKEFFSDPKNIDRYRGQRGCIEFIEEHFKYLQMHTVFTYAALALSTDDMNHLNWRRYRGTTDEFKKERSQILDEEGNVRTEYLNPKGYILYADEFYGGEKKEKGNMFKAFSNVSAVLFESEKRNLNWKVYQGTTEEFKKERSQILDEEGNVRTEYLNSKGYILYADKFYGGKKKEKGNMLQAFLNISAVLSESEKRNLNWKVYQGNTKEFKKERSQILDEKGVIRKEYQGPKGNALYADDFYGGEKQEKVNMQKVYQNVSAVLSKDEMRSLGWKQYRGTTEEFKKERSQILDEKGHIRRKYRDTEGHILYADEFYGGEKKEKGNMFKAFSNVSVVLSKEEMRILNWRWYQGTTDEFKKEKSQILDEEGNVRTEYRDTEGHILYANEFYGGEKKEHGDMIKAYQSVSAVLSKEKMRSLGWKQYRGTTEKFKKERSQILDEKGAIREEYQGPKGNALYADNFYGGEKQEQGDMQKAYQNVSAVLSKEEMQILGWQKYQGTTEEFKKERSQILDEEGNARTDYRDTEGHILYANEFYGGKKKENGDMYMAYRNVSAVLSKEEMKDLGWKTFNGNTNQFHALSEFFKNHNFEDYKGADGQKKISILFFNNHLYNTYRNTSALRGYLFNDKDEFKELRKSGWSIDLSW